MDGLQSSKRKPKWLWFLGILVLVVIGVELSVDLRSGSEPEVTGTNGYELLDGIRDQIVEMEGIVGWQSPVDQLLPSQLEAFAQTNAPALRQLREALKCDWTPPSMAQQMEPASSYGGYLGLAPRLADLLEADVRLLLLRGENQMALEVAFEILSLGESYSQGEMNGGFLAMIRLQTKGVLLLRERIEDWDASQC